MLFLRHLRRLIWFNNVMIIHQLRGALALHIAFMRYCKGNEICPRGDFDEGSNSLTIRTKLKQFPYPVKDLHDCWKS